MKSVLLDSLPYEDGDRLVRVYGRGAEEAAGRLPLSPGEFVDYVERQHSLARVGRVLLDDV